jgi:large subunit ribosomal protein L13
MGTFSAKSGEVERRWFVLDATDKPLGRLASHIATILQGKNRPVYTSHCDTGDFVVVINAAKVKLTGKKRDTKFYRRHSQIPGGYKEEPYRILLARKPEFAIEKAVKGMLPKSSLGRKLQYKLKVYAGPAHPHSAQNPVTLDI